MSSFYVMLPSNTNIEGNTPSSFTCRLPNVIDLSEGEWAVGLSSIIYPGSFYGDDKQDLWVEILYFEESKKDDVKINIPDTVFKNVKAVEKTVNETIMGRQISGVREKRAPQNVPIVLEGAPRSESRKRPHSLSAFGPETEETRKLKAAKWWFDGLGRDIEGAMTEIKNLYNESKTKVNSVRERELPQYNEKIKIAHEFVMKAWERFGLLFNRAIEEANEATNLIEQGMRAYNASNATEAHAPINRLKKIKDIFLGTVNTKGVESEGYVTIAKRNNAEISTDADSFNNLFKDLPQLAPWQLEKLETAKRWAVNLKKEIEEAKKNIDNLFSESQETITAIHKIKDVDKSKIKEVNDKMEEFKKFKNKTDADATEASNAHSGALIAFDEKNVTKTQQNTDNLKKIKALFVGEGAYGELAEGYRNTIINDKNSLLDTLSPEEKIIQLNKEKSKKIKKEQSQLEKAELKLLDDINDSNGSVQDETKKLSERIKKILSEHPIHDTRHKLSIMQGEIYHIPIETDNKVFDVDELKTKFAKFLANIDEDLKSVGVTPMSEIDLVEGRALVEDFQKISSFVNDKLKDLRAFGPKIDTLLNENEKKESEFKRTETRVIDIKDEITHIMEGISSKITEIESKTAMIEDRSRRAILELPHPSEDVDDMELKGIFNNFQNLSDNVAKIRRESQKKREELAILFNEYDEFWMGLVQSIKERNLDNIKKQLTISQQIKPKYATIDTYINEQLVKLKTYKNQFDNYLMVAKDLSEEISEGMKANIKRVREVVKSKFTPVELKDLTIYFYYDENMGKFFLYNNMPKTIKGVRLSKNAGLLLGFDIDDSGLVKGLRMRYDGGYAKYTPDISLGVHHMYVYMPDIIEPTYVGDKQAPVLRIVNVDTAKQTDTVYTVEDIFPVEYHHRVVEKRISQIKIQLRTAYGNLFKFSWGAVVLTLHFKRSIF